MGLFEYNFDSDTLRAIGHARLHLRAGRGLESIVHALARADLGVVSDALQPALVRMQEGYSGEEVLQEQAERAENKSYREMLTALMLEGDAAIVRLEELSDEIQVEKKIKTEQYGESLGGTLNLVSIVFLGTFVPIFMSILESIPENDMLPTLVLPKGFYTGYYLMLCAALTIGFSSMRYRG